MASQLGNMIKIKINKKVYSVEHEPFQISMCISVPINTRLYRTSTIVDAENQRKVSYKKYFQENDYNM